ncbi:hypothetical protein [Epibacterium ulvae]|uniref:hypothetical protein n=1 Tax=Epibacterium ulvae TaxID=1156985 RepID=UPI002490A76E|nr:hypothetical protein [Epibacterium ulvae]
MASSQRPHHLLADNQILTAEDLVKLVFELLGIKGLPKGEIAKDPKVVVIFDAVLQVSD